MIWAKEPLLAKAKLFFERARNGSPEDPEFGLWNAFGLELLARAALAKISPTLLALPSDDHKYLRYALGSGVETGARRSIPANLVFSLCNDLVKGFGKREATIARALAERRNEELHSGASAFVEYSANKWLPDFYRSCVVLGNFLNTNLEELFGETEAADARRLMVEVTKDTRQAVQDKISACRKVFEGKARPEQDEARKQAETLGEELSRKRRHRAQCPACNSVGTQEGDSFGRERVEHADGEIIVRQTVAPVAFQCTACGLKLNGFSELEAAELGSHYSRRTAYSPEEYYSLVDPDNLPDHVIQRCIDEHLSSYGYDYDNE